MIPAFETERGVGGCYQLPLGIHVATWAELVERFGNNERRREILASLLRALQALKAAGCRRVYVDGSFVTSKEGPGDFDGCWDHEGDGHPMITNERQYLITQAQAAKFREALADAPAEGIHPKALKAMRDGAQSQLAELEDQLAEYDALRAGAVVSFEVDSITGIGEALVKARIIRNLTHKGLATRMGLVEQQIQRYEATRYAGVSIERLQAVADALNLRVNEVFTLEKE